jgi:hypothetical protein
MHVCMSMEAWQESTHKAPLLLPQGVPTPVAFLVTAHFDAMHRYVLN